MSFVKRKEKRGGERKRAPRKRGECRRTRGQGREERMKENGRPICRSCDECQSPIDTSQNSSSVGTTGRRKWTQELLHTDATAGVGPYEYSCSCRTHRFLLCFIRVFTTISVGEIKLLSRKNKTAREIVSLPVFLHDCLPASFSCRVLPCLERIVTGWCRIYSIKAQEQHIADIQKERKNTPRTQ